jgi:hypothetical protein
LNNTGIIYEIKFENDKSYIGQSINFEKRKIIHEWHAKSGNEGLLYRAMRKYKYEWVILEEIDKSKLDDTEIYYIKLKNSFTNGYNLNTGGKQSIKVHSYTYDDFYNSAIKYNSKAEWRKSKDKYLCDSCRKNYPEIYKEVTKHMKRPKRGFSDEYIISVANKYEYLHEFRKEQNSLYTLIYRRKLIDKTNLKKLKERRTK